MQEKPKFLELRDKAQRYEKAKEFKRAARTFARHLGSNHGPGDDSEMYSHYDDALSAISKEDVNLLKEDAGTREGLEAIVGFTGQRVGFLLRSMNYLEKSDKKKAYSIYKKAASIVKTLEDELRPEVVRKLKTDLASYVIPKHLELLEDNFSQEKLDWVVSEIGGYRRSGVEVTPYIARLAMIKKRNS